MPLTQDCLVKVDQITAGALYYVGRSLRGNATSSESWEIIRITISSGDVDIESPTEVPKGTAIWDNRASYTYG